MKKKLLVAVAIGTTLSTSAAQAGNLNSPAGTLNSDPCYIGLSVGAMVPNNIGFSMSGTFSGSGDMTLNTGPAVLGMAGCHINDYLSVEEDLGYASHDWNSLNLNGAVFGMSGHAHSVIGLANAFIYPLAQSHFSPYIGGGFGFVNVDSSIDYLTLGGTTIPVNSSSNETDLAADAVVGLDYSISNRVSIGGRYQFMWINSGSTETSSGLTIKSDDFTGNLFTAQVTYRF